jgi:F-type H+-transporting ATPase subunit b
VLLALLAKFAWTPLLDALESRQASIRKSLDDAAQARQELEKLHDKSVLIIREARVEAESIITKSRADAERLRAEMKEKARAEADGIVRNAERQIQLETTRALQQIRTEAVDLSVMIASKIIQRNLSKEDNERLIEEALKQVQSRH